MAAKTVNPRSITDAERPWLEAWSLPVQIQLIGLVRARTSNEVALGLAGWLTGKYAGEDLAGMATKASYRKILRELAAEGVTPDPVALGSLSARRSVRRAAGSVRRAAGTAGLANLGTVAMASAGAVALGSLYITYSPGPEAAGGENPVQQLALWTERHDPGTCTVLPFARPAHVSRAA